jgi:V/A-type H+-transporting ATPase subunit I
MARIAVLGLKKYRQQVISILYEMNVMQLEPISKEANSFLANEHESDYHRQVSDQLLRIRGLINSLPPTALTGKTKFSSIDDLIQKVKSIDIDSTVASLQRQKEGLLTQMKETENNIKLLEEYSFFPDDLDILHLSSARSFFGRIDSKRFSEFKSKLQLDDDESVLYVKEGDKLTHFAIVVMPSFPSDTFASIVSMYHVHLEAIPNLKGKPDILAQEQKKNP